MLSKKNFFFLFFLLTIYNFSFTQRIYRFNKLKIDKFVGEDLKTISSEKKESEFIISQDEKIISFDIDGIQNTLQVYKKSLGQEGMGYSCKDSRGRYFIVALDSKNSFLSLLYFDENYEFNSVKFENY